MNLYGRHFGETQDLVVMKVRLHCPAAQQARFLAGWGAGAGGLVLFFVGAIITAVRAR